MTVTAQVEGFGDRTPGSWQYGERTIGRLISYAAETYGDRPFVYFDSSSISYAEANRRANRVANGLSGLGIGKHGRVAILCGNRPEYLDLWFGLAKLGAIEMPINPACKAPQIRHVLSRSPADLLVLEQELLPEYLEAAKSLPPIRTLMLSGSNGESYAELIGRACDDEPPDPEVSDTDPVAIMNTSGTTGLSKGVLLPHAQQFSLAQTMSAALRMDASDTFYNNFPLFHNTAQAMITLPVVMTGGAMILVEKFSTSRFFSDVRAHGATLFYFIGEMLHLLVRADETDGGRLRAGWGIGAASDDMRRFEERYGVELGTCYGSTEGNVPVVRRLGAALPERSVGQVIAGFDLRIVDPEGHDLPHGDVGEIIERADDRSMVMIGYDGDAEGTREALRGGWFHSGDAGSLDADGNLYFEGRIKDVIRVGGENISGFEIEQALLECEAVIEAAAIAVPRDIGGDDIKVVVVPRSGAQLDLVHLLGHCAARLPKYAVPRYFEAAESLPKTETNKVRKAALREQGLGKGTWDSRTGEFLS